MNYRYGNYANPYMQPYGLPNYTQPQYQMQSQPMAQPQTAQQQAQQPIETQFSYLGYGNYKEVESHLLFPTQKALFIDRANNMFYEKICNNDGISVINQYRRVEDKAPNQAVETTKEHPTIDLSSYVKKEDLGAFVSLKQYSELLNQIEQLKKQLGGKQNGNKQG